MADLSKIKLNGIEYNLKDTVARNAVSPPLATQNNDGLLSASDKRLLDNLNPNVVATLSNINTCGFIIKADNIFILVLSLEPKLLQSLSNK